MKKLLLSIFVLLALFSVTFAQGLGCPADTSLGLPAASNGDQYCDSSINSAYYECTNGAWLGMSCPNPTDTCSQNTNTITCGSAITTTCDPAPYSLTPANVGDQYCDSNIQSAYYECTSGGFWAGMSCPTPSDTCVGNGNKIDCQPPVTCDPEPDSGSLTPANEGDQYCDPNIQTAYYECGSGGFWVGKSCPNNLNCFDMGDKISCQSGAPLSSCVNPAGFPGDEICQSNSVYICSKGQWILDAECSKVNADCILQGKDAYCKVREGSSGGSSGSSGSTDGTITGGGEVNRDSCQKYSDWFVDSSSPYFDYDDSGRQRNCTKSVLKRWCIDSQGKYDYDNYKSKEETKCDEWAEDCEFVYDRTESYTDSSGTQCRSCTKEIYVEQCQPSGKINYQNTQQTDSCGDWMNCEQLKATTNPQGSATQEKDNRSDLQILMDDYGLIIGALIAALVLVVAYTAWKFFSEPVE